MIREVLAQTTKDVAVPGAVTGATKLLGITLPDVVMYLTIVIALQRIIANTPKLIGCLSCWWRNKGCDNRCKNLSIE